LITAAGFATANVPRPNANDDLLRHTATLPSAAELSLAYESVAGSLEPSVVSIKSVNRVRAQQAVHALPFRHFPFGGLVPFDPNSDPRNQSEIPQHEFLQQGLGTGSIFREDGYVVTNHHVVKDSDEITVTLWDESEHTASVVGTDPKTDLAVLRIAAEGLTPAPLGDDSKLRVGHWVAALGNPFGLNSTMTAGIVSAVGRSHVGLADYENFIQTDAAINPGNSGGPLVNLDGEVVGINTAIFSKSGGYMGIGFAIPINMAKKIVDSLIEDGHVQRGFLGVVIQDLGQDLAASFDRDSTDGALVSDVPAGSPAAKAGIRPGDIIIRMGDDPIEDIDSLRFLAANTTPGTIVSIAYVRDGQEQIAEVEMGELESTPPTHTSARDSRSLGMSLQSLTGAVARQLDIEADTRGVLVTRVEPFSEASRAGIRLNDVILNVNGTDIENVSDFERALRDKDQSKGVRLTVLSGSTQRFLFLRTDTKR